MTDSSRYPTTPIGQELGRFYNHRSMLRRTVPLFSVGWQDFIRYLKGEAAMTATAPRKTEHHHTAGHGPRHHNHLRAHA